MLIALFIFCCSGVQRSVANKESKSFPPTQHGDFQHHATLKSDSKRERQRLGKDKGVCVFVCGVSFSLWSARVHLSSQKRNTPAFLICLKNTNHPSPPKKTRKGWIFTYGRMCDFSLDLTIQINAPACLSLNRSVSVSAAHWLYRSARRTRQAGGLCPDAVSQGQDCKTLVKRRALGSQRSHLLLRWQVQGPLPRLRGASVLISHSLS